MGSKEEWQAYQDALRRGDKAAAAEYFRRYLDAKKAEGKGGSKPTLVTLRRGGGKDNAIPLDQLADRMITSPTVYDRVRRIVTKEK